MSRLGVVLVVFLVLLAGCSGFAGDDGPPDRERYGVDEEVNASVEDEPEEILPGLTTEGLAESGELHETHEEVIGNQSYTIEIEHEYAIRDENDSFRQTSNSTLYVDPEAEVVHEVAHQRFEGNVSILNPHAEAQPNRTVEEWFGEETVSMTELENGSIEYTPPQQGMRRGHDRVDQASIRLLAPIESLEETTTAGAIESEEGTYYVVEGWENASEGEAEHGQEFETEARTLVREDGLVRQTVSDQMIVEGDDQRFLTNQTVEITDIGETTVERPDWYEEAVVAGPDESDGPGDGEDG